MTVLKAIYNKISLLLTADASTEIEEAIAEKYDVTATILEAGHHGSSKKGSTNLYGLYYVNRTV